MIFYYSLLVLNYLAFYGVYFARQVSLARQGVRASLLGRGDKPARTLWVERLLLITTVGMAAAQFFGLLRHWGKMAPTPAMWAGLGVGAVGAVFFSTAAFTMGASWRAGVDTATETRMVTQGIYRHSRNPAFVGFNLLYWGTALSLPSVWLVAGAALATVLFHLQILEEERFLNRSLGEQYRIYRKAVPRYLGFL